MFPRSAGASAGYCFVIQANDSLKLPLLLFQTYVRPIDKSLTLQECQAICPMGARDQTKNRTNLSLRISILMNSVASGRNLKSFPQNSILKPKVIKYQSTITKLIKICLHQNSYIIIYVNL